MTAQLQTDSAHPYAHLLSLLQFDHLCASMVNALLSKQC